MAAGLNATKLADLLDPQVVADFIDHKLIDAIRFAPLCHIDNTLVGRPGDTVTLPQYNYVGDAQAVNEGADIPIAKLTQSTNTVQVSKIGRAIEFTDEALLSGYNNDIAQEAAQQVVTAINSKLESDLITAMKTSANLVTTVRPAASGFNPADALADALVMFGEDIDGDKVLVIPPSYYGLLRKSTSWVPNTEIGASAIVRGVVGMVHGCQVITSNRVEGAATVSYVDSSDTAITAGKVYYTRSGSSPNYVYTEVETPVLADIATYYEKVTTYANSYAFIVKPGALAIYMKRNTLVEFDRDIIAETNFIKASKIFAPYVYDTSKLIRIKIDRT